MSRAQSICERFAAALLEDDAPRDAELQAHLASCSGCRALRRVHELTSKLSRGVPDDPPLSPIVLAQVVRVVRRRRLGRAAAGSLALASSCAALLWLRPTPGAPPLAPAAADVFQLMAQVEGFASRDVVRQDTSYDAFGAVATWVAPEAARALDAPLSRRAAADLTALDENEDEKEVAP